jgi:hypothetical protein
MDETATPLNLPSNWRFLMRLSTGGDTALGQTERLNLSKA